MGKCQFKGILRRFAPQDDAVWVWKGIPMITVLPRDDALAFGVIVSGVIAAGNDAVNRSPSEGECP